MKFKNCRHGPGKSTVYGTKTPAPGATSPIGDPWRWLAYVRDALMGAIATTEGFGFERLRATPELWGRMTESAVGAELLARHLEHSSTQPLIHYWRDGIDEVDYVLRHQGEWFAFEVKSGVNRGDEKGLDAFCKWQPGGRPLVLGTRGLPLQAWFEATDCRAAGDAPGSTGPAFLRASQTSGG